MISYIAKEGTPTEYGGRTVRVEAAMRPTTARNRRIEARYLDGSTAAELSEEFYLSMSGIYCILHAMRTPMRPKGKRAA